MRIIVATNIAFSAILNAISKISGITLRSLLCILLMVSCKKNDDVVDNLKIEGKWTIVSSGSYEKNDPTVVFLRLNYPTHDDSIIFNNNGTGNSSALTYNFWHGPFKYSFIPSKNTLKTIGNNYSVYHNVSFLGTNSIAISLNYSDTLYTPSFKIISLTAIDTLVR